MQSSGLEMERLVAPRGIPINIPTRGYTGGIMQVGVLHKEEVTDDSKKIGQNTEPVILPLFGRPTYNGSNKWSYYTSTDKMNQVKLPISNKIKYVIVNMDVMSYMMVILYQYQPIWGFQGVNI